MKHLRPALPLVLTLALAWTCRASAIDNAVDYVNPLMGTQSSHALSSGNTYPAIATPWGMNFWTPQTGRMGDGWAYTYTAEKIRGFKQTHQPSPWMNDYGTFSLMPLCGQPRFDQDERASWFSHKAETSTPYYYKVYLADHDITTEIAPTCRAALFRFTFPECDSSYIVVDAFDRGSYVRIMPEERKIIGYTTRNSGGVPENFRNYFVLSFDRPFTYTATVRDGQDIDTSSTESRSRHSGAIIGFATHRGEQVNVRVASSFISPEQAEQNLLELGCKPLEKVADEARSEWNDVLGRIDVRDMSNTDRLRTFYSCLYRSVLFPRTFYEIDSKGHVLHYSPYNGRVLPGYMFTDTGFWDTFRCLFPLLNLIYPDMALRMQEGWANSFRESGFLPEWCSPGHRDCMVGNNSASVIADACLKGIRIRDTETLWQAVTHGANAYLKGTASGRRRWRDYNRLGYVPYDSVRESAARTLEYAYDDWCIYRLGQALGKPQSEIDIYARRALNYRHLFDREHRLMRGRMADGSWAPDFNPFKWGDAFTEGNSLHYTWSVFHDPQGLIDLMGGCEAFNSMLDTVFVLPPVFDAGYYGGVIHEIREMQIMNMGNYAHGNQPIQHMIYLYNYSGAPWKAQYRLRETMNRLYNAHPDGYCGDEDNGQTSAWYVFTAMGFYPVCPGSGQYVLGAPYFRHLTLRLQNGNTVEINAPANSDSHRYIEHLDINGRPHDLNYITHSDLMQGMVMDYTMTDSPNRRRGTSPQAAPYSFSNEQGR